MIRNKDYGRADLMNQWQHNVWHSNVDQAGRACLQDQRLQLAHAISGNLFLERQISLASSYYMLAQNATARRLSVLGSEAKVRLSLTIHFIVQLSMQDTCATRVRSRMFKEQRNK
jgi:hypothetical protein